MLSMSDLHKKKHRTPSPPIDNETPPEDQILSMSDLPSRGRRHQRAQVAIKEAAKPAKILTISDLPKRTRNVRKLAAEVRRTVATGKGAGSRMLGPKVFADYVRKGAWKGRRCFIIGGGPSVKNVDLDLLRGELTIGINRAYELLDPSILFGVDGQMWGWVEQGKCGEESKRKFNEYKGYKVWMALHDVFPPDFYLIDVDDRGGYRIGSTKLLAFKNNSGYGAINLAAALGANPIYLLGFDMQGDKQGKQKWWHDGYPMDYGENVYTRYIEEITKFAPVLEKSGFEVVNLNPKSALKCFTFGNYKQVIKRKPIIPEGAIQAMTKPGMITAITPTGDRPLAFALCKHWMDMQTVRPDQWIVVDDGKVPIKPPAGATYIRRAPKHNDPNHTLNLNLRTAVPSIRGSKIIIIEDDEYYAPKYIETMAKELNNGELVGVMQAKYYHLPTGGYMQIANTFHASLAQTAFNITFLPTVQEYLDGKLSIYLDMKLWQRALPEGRGYLFADGRNSLYAGIKGLPGRPGIGQGHNPAMYGASIDKSREILKKWIPRDYKVYEAVLSGELNDANCNTYFHKITGVVVCQNTIDLMKCSYGSVRKFHPDMPIIIIDGSDPGSPCAAYVKGLASDVTTVLSLGYNIGHGRGMCMGINEAKTPYALMFDSDIEMLKSPVDEMCAMMEPDTFGVGYIEEKTGFDGYEWGWPGHADPGNWMPYLHPMFQLISIANYRKYYPYVHHGAPCYLTMLDIFKKGLSHKILKQFPGMGHSSGKGLNWAGKPREHIRHDPGTTIRERTGEAPREIEGGWVMNEGLV